MLRFCYKVDKMSLVTYVTNYSYYSFIFSELRGLLYNKNDFARSIYCDRNKEVDTKQLKMKQNTGNFFT